MYRGFEMAEGMFVTFVCQLILGSKRVLPDVPASKWAAGRCHFYRLQHVGIVFAPSTLVVHARIANPVKRQVGRSST
jgi:hypothetical protein